MVICDLDEGSVKAEHQTAVMMKPLCKYMKEIEHDVNVVTML